MTEASGMHRQGQLIASMIDTTSKAHAAAVVERQLERQPDAVERYGAGSYRSLVHDTEMRLLALAESVAAGRPALFEDEVRWLKVFLCAREVPLQLLDVNLECLADELAARLPRGLGGLPGQHVANARDALDTAPSELPSLLDGEGPLIEVARSYLLAVLEGRRGDALVALTSAREAGASVAELHEHVIARAQAELGRMWQMAEIQVGEEHLGSRMAEEALALLRGAKPSAPATGPRVIAACVAGGRHDLVCRMLADQFELEGWRAYLLGADLPAADLQRSVRDFEADLVVLSAPLLLHVREAARQVSTLRAKGDVTILVGGRPFNVVDDLWQVVGADGFARTAREGVKEALRLAGRRG